MRTIRSRPRSSSSVPRNPKPTQNDSSSKNTRIVSRNFDENESDNSFQKPKINPSRNSQWRKLRPPNFQSFVKNESKSSDPQNESKQYDNIKKSNENKSKFEKDSSISRINTSSSTRRAQSLNRQRKNYNNDEVKKNDEYDYDFYFNHQLNQSKQTQNESKIPEHRKNSINFDEFKNPDGSPRKISQKFRHLNRQQPKNDEDSMQSVVNINPPRRKQDISTPRKESSIIRKKRSDSVSNSITTNPNLPSNPKDNLISTPNISSKYNKRPSKIEASFKDSESEQVVSSIEIALNRIQKELKRKETDQPNINKETKPVIKKKKRPFLEQQQQNQTTINLPNYDLVENEQKNKSVIEEVKPHVQFIDSVKPPRKKEFVPTIVETNVEREPKSFVEPTKSDFNKKIEFPRDYMKNIYSSFMNSSNNE